MTPHNHQAALHAKYAHYGPMDASDDDKIAIFIMESGVDAGKAAFGTQTIEKLATQIRDEQSARMLELGMPESITEEWKGWFDIGHAEAFSDALKSLVETSGSLLAYAACGR